MDGHINILQATLGT